jgi:hypothetical protein
MSSITLGVFRPRGGGAAVAHSGEANQTVNFSGVNGFTLPNQTSAGANRIGVLHVGGFLGASGTTAATWNGAAMTVTQLGAGGDAVMFHIVAPATAASDVICSNLNGASGQAAASTYINANQSGGSGPIRNSATATNTSATASVSVTTVAGDMVVDACAYDASAPAPTFGANQNTVLNTEANNGADMAASYKLGADGGTMSESFSGSVYWETVAASIMPA